MERSESREPRHIDGIVLTKFDTIDDKVCIGSARVCVEDVGVCDWVWVCSDVCHVSVCVCVCACCSLSHHCLRCRVQVGAAVSMVYKTGQPIIFVGNGQKYFNLRKLNVDQVVKALLH